MSEREPITVSFSELDTFRQCFYKHELAYGQRWQLESRPDNSALSLGGMYHTILETHYNTIKAHQITVLVDTEGAGLEVSQDDWDCTFSELMAACKQAVANVILQWVVAERDLEVIKTLEWMYAGYLERYKLDEAWTIVEVESTDVIPLLRADGSDSGINLKVKIDLLVRDSRGLYWVIDHKSAASVGRDDQDHDWNDQFGLYVAAKRRQGLNVMGAIHSAALKKPNKGDFLSPGDEGYKASMKPTDPDARFKRTALNRTELECQSILDDALADAELAYSPANHKRRHANPDTCKWRCDFKEACIFGRRTNDESKVVLTLERTGFVQNFTRH